MTTLVPPTVAPELYDLLTTDLAYLDEVDTVALRVARGRFLKPVFTAPPADAVALWLDDLRTRKAKHTVTGYALDLRRLVAFADVRFGGRWRLDMLGVPEVRRYLGHLRRNLELGDRSVARALHAVRTFFRFCQCQGWIDWNPAAAVSVANEGNRGLPRWLKLEQVIKLCDLLTVSVKAPPRGRGRGSGGLGWRPMAG